MKQYLSVPPVLATFLIHGVSDRFAVGFRQQASKILNSQANNGSERESSAQKMAESRHFQAIRQTQKGHQYCVGRCFEIDFCRGLS